MPASGSSRSSRVPRCHLAIAAAVGAALIVGACSKGERGTRGSESTAAAAPAGSTAAPSTQAPGGAPANTTAAGGAVAGSTAAGGAGGANAVTNANVSPSSITAKEIALGDSIFHGQAAGGLCFTCHGADAKGTQLAPPLIKQKWVTGDGSYGFLVARITAGVPNPTPPYPGPMLPKGGAQLTDAQVKAVAAYVYSLNHPNVGKKSS